MLDFFDNLLYNERIGVWWWVLVLKKATLWWPDLKDMRLQLLHCTAMVVRQLA